MTDPPAVAGSGWSDDSGLEGRAPRDCAGVRARQWVSVCFWWLVTLGTLVVLDDLTFGPVFWAISRWRGPTLAVALAVGVYTVSQIFIVHQGTSRTPHAVARFFLDRLDLNRRHREVARREDSLRHRVIGGATALAVAPIVGGVIPPMVLWRSGYGRTYVRRVSIPCAVIYAIEFSLLHGALPALGSSST